MLNVEAEINLKAYLSTAALPGQTTKTALTEEFMFQNVAYRPTVYITGPLTYLGLCQQWFEIHHCEFFTVQFLYNFILFDSTCGRISFIFHQNYAVFEFLSTSLMLHNGTKIFLNSYLIIS